MNKFFYVFCLIVFVFSLQSVSLSSWVDVGLGTSEVTRAVAMSESGKGYICGFGGLIANTSDMGKSWAIVNTSTTESFIKTEMISSNSALFLADRSRLFSAEGGTFHYERPYIDIGSIIFLTLDFFVDGENMYAVGAPVTSEGYYNFAKSTDGGKTWALASLIGGTYECAVSKVYFADSNNGWIKAYRNVKSTSPYEFDEKIYKTSDGGVTWKEVYTKRHVTTNSSAMYYLVILYPGGISSNGNNVFISSSDTSDTVGFLPKILKSSNFGETWTEQIIGEIGALSDLKVFDKNVVVVSGALSIEGNYCGIMKSVDGGVSWAADKGGVNFGLKSIYSSGYKLFAVSTKEVFSYYEPSTPVVASISKNKFLQGTSDIATIEGTSFEAPARITFSNSGVTGEVETYNSSSEITVRIFVSNDAATGESDITVSNFYSKDATLSSSLEILRSVSSSFEIFSVNPRDFYQGDASFPVIIRGNNIPDISSGGLVEIDAGSGISFYSSRYVDSSTIASYATVDASALTGGRNLSVVVKGSTGEVLGSCLLSGGIVVSDPSSEVKIDELVPLVNGGIWKPSSAGAPLPDLDVQVRVSEPGSYDVVISSPRGIEYKTVKALSKGTNKIVIPGNKEWTNGIKVLTVFKDGKKAKLMIPVFR